MKRKALVIIGVALYAQIFALTTPEKALQKFNDGHYHQAIQLFQKEISSTKENHKLALYYFKVGQAQHYLLQHEKALLSFNKSLTKGFSESSIYFFKGKSEMATGKYEKAQASFRKITNTTPKLFLLAKEQILICNKVIKLSSITDDRIKIERKELLSTSKHDVGIKFLQDTGLFVTYSSYEVNASSISEVTGEAFPDLFYSRISNRKESTPKSYSKPINSEFSEGSACFNKQGDIIILTRCLTKANQNNKCYLYYSVKSKDVWSIPTIIDLDSNYSFGHPCLNRDETKLYFSSDLKGGKGGKDIWYIDIKLDQKEPLFGNPKLVKGSINTPFNELYPFIDFDNQIYFSSNGHNSLGGYDIFKYSIGKNQVNCLPKPINSSGDDLGYAFSKENKYGYLSSNRDDPSGQLDIYGFYIEESEEIEIVLPYIHYKYDDHLLTESSKDSLINLVNTLKTHPKLEITLIAHTDSRGSLAYNSALSLKRAKSVVDFLIENGISKTRLKALGNGEITPRRITNNLLPAIPSKWKTHFPVGSTLNESFIKALESDELKEFAHQLNRRTSFMKKKE